MYWSAAFWTMGRTVVEPLIVIVCFWPDDTGAVVDTGAGTCVFAAPVEGAVGAGVATVVFVPLSIQPATIIEAMSNATRLMVRNRNERLCVFMVF